MAEVDNEARERVELLTEQLAKAEGITEGLRSREQMVWVVAINNIKVRAEEIVYQEIVHA